MSISPAHQVLLVWALFKTAVAGAVASEVAMQKRESVFLFLCTAPVTMRPALFQHHRLRKLGCVKDVSGLPLRGSRQQLTTDELTQGVPSAPAAD